MSTVNQPMETMFVVIIALFLRFVSVSLRVGKGAGGGGGEGGWRLVAWWVCLGGMYVQCLVAQSFIREVCVCVCDSLCGACLHWCGKHLTGYRFRSSSRVTQGSGVCFLLRGHSLLCTRAHGWMPQQLSSAMNNQTKVCWRKTCTRFYPQMFC